MYLSTVAGTKSWKEQVVSCVNERLLGFLEEQHARTSKLSPRAHELVDAIADLSLRGGKRMRSLAIYAGFRSVSSRVSPADWEAVITLSASLELLQTYLLIQDDWMDDDDERRGGPSVHAALSRKVGDNRLGASLAILAGDMAMGFAIELLHATPFPPRRSASALQAFTSMHLEVVCGQQLDLHDHEAVTLTHHLKTGSYTVRGPVSLGAMLGSATDAQLKALERVARPLGVAFQLRDDLLGTFGDSKSTGKPAGHDLREGKNTALVYEARRLLSGADRARLDAVLGNAAVSNSALDEVAASLERSGARARVEAELAQRLGEARAALLDPDAPLLPSGVEMLLAFLEQIAQRVS